MEISKSLSLLIGSPLMMVEKVILHKLTTEGELSYHSQSPTEIVMDVIATHILLLMTRLDGMVTMDTPPKRCFL
jgi:hypothetical protein